MTETTQLILHLTPSQIVPMVFVLISVTLLAILSCYYVARIGKRLIDSDFRREESDEEVEEPPVEADEDDRMLV